MGQWCPPYYGKSTFYQDKKAEALKEIEKLENKLAELREVVAECDAELDKQVDEKRDFD